MEAMTTTNKQRTREEVIAWLKGVCERKEAWKEDVRRREAELQVELQRAKDDPFYQRGTEGMACEPTPMVEPVFKCGNFAAAIRKHRVFQSQWQESINQKLLHISTLKSKCSKATNRSLFPLMSTSASLA